MMCFWIGASWFCSFHGITYYDGISSCPFHYCIALLASVFCPFFYYEGGTQLRLLNPHNHRFWPAYKVITLYGHRRLGSGPSLARTTPSYPNGCLSCKVRGRYYHMCNRLA
jgi:hypothetical protein